MTERVSVEELNEYAAAKGQALALVWGQDDQFCDVGKAIWVDGPVQVGGVSYAANIIFNYNAVPTPWGSTHEIITDVREENGTVLGYGRCKVGIDGQPATMQAVNALPRYVP
jgi:hypothetical protein